MTPDMSRQLRVPAGMSPVRYKPPLPVHTPPEQVEVPFIAPDDPAHKQVQQMWVAQTRVFNLGNKTELADYQGVWQLLSDGHGQVCEQKLDFDPKQGTYIAFLRWAKYEAYAPGALPSIAQPIPAADPQAQVKADIIDAIVAAALPPLIVATPPPAG